MQRTWVYALAAVVLLSGVAFSAVGLFHVRRVGGLTSGDVRQIRAELSPYIHCNPFSGLADWRRVGIRRAAAFTMRDLPDALRHELLLRVGRISRNLDGSVAVELVQGKSLYCTCYLKRERNHWKVYGCYVPNVGPVDVPR